MENGVPWHHPPRDTARRILIRGASGGSSWKKFCGDGCRIFTGFPMEPLRAPPSIRIEIANKKALFHAEKRTSYSPSHRSWVQMADVKQAGLLTRLPRSSCLPSFPVTSWSRSASQWRDRAGFSPASLLSPRGHLFLFIGFSHCTIRGGPCQSMVGNILKSFRLHVPKGSIHSRDFDRPSASAPRRLPARSAGQSEESSSAARIARPRATGVKRWNAAPSRMTAAGTAP